MTTYDRTQKGWVWIVLPVLGVSIFAMGFILEPVAARVSLMSSAALMFVLSAALGWLRIRDEGNRLFVGYGPLPLFRRRIDYSAITAVERVKPPALLGIGLRWFPGYGWTWNINTGDLVRLHFGDRVFHVGSADPDELVALIEQRIMPR